MKNVRFVQLLDSERFGLIQLMLIDGFHRTAGSNVLGIQYAINHIMENDTFQVSKDPSVSPEVAEEVLWVPLSGKQKHFFA